MLQSTLRIITRETSSRSQQKNSNFPDQDLKHVLKSQERLSRTNNVVEGWHNDFASSIACSHPNTRGTRKVFSHKFSFH